MSTDITCGRCGQSGPAEVLLSAPPASGAGACVCWLCRKPEEYPPKVHEAQDRPSWFWSSEVRYRQNILRIWLDYRRISVLSFNKQDPDMVVSFKEPVELAWRRTAKNHVIRAIKIMDNRLYYTQMRRWRSKTTHFGMHEASRYAGMKISECPKSQRKIESFQEFFDRFTPGFISQEVALRLWQGGYGNSYGRFRRLSPTASRVVESFLQKFQGVSASPNQHYILNRHQRRELCVWRSSTGRSGGVFGRDISVTHYGGEGKIYFSSEYPGIGNGKYYLLSSPKEVLFIEED